MKQLTTILLILIVFLQTFSRFVIEADYLLNKSYIASVLCVNKAKPKMNCNGKCYMAKQLKEEHKQDQQTPSAKKSKIEVQLFSLAESPQLNNCIKSNYIKHISNYRITLSTFHPAIFHPPAV
ncbi:MAG TPA: hypothetical protein VF610_04360 [Segetibacter sp.]